MAELKLNVEEIKALMAEASRLGLQKVSLQQDGFSLKIEGKQPVVVAASEQAAPVVLSAAPTAAPAQPAANTEEEVTGTPVLSPIVGTFYSKPAPDKEPFVKVGDTVKKGDVLFIIESMKLMNEVNSEVDGVVTKILVEDGQGVEFHQPILIVE